MSLVFFLNAHPRNAIFLPDTVLYNVVMMLSACLGKTVVGAESKVVLLFGFGVVAREHINHSAEVADVGAFVAEVLSLVDILKSLFEIAQAGVANRACKVVTWILAERNGLRKVVLCRTVVVFAES